MKKENLSLMITGAICLFGCAFLFIYNVIEANYSEAEIIQQWEYSEPIIFQSLPETISQSDSMTSSDLVSAGVNINTASAKQIADALPGIGPAKAQAIIEYRELIGSFGSVDELIRVDGIGKKTLEKIRPYCRISD